MAKLNPNVVAKWIETRWHNEGQYPLLDVLIDILRMELCKNGNRLVSAEEIAENAEDLLPTVANALNDICDGYLRQGVNPSFTLDPDALYYSSHENAERCFRNKLFSMSPKGFEYFCKHILEKLLGHATVSGGPYDGGIDFFAVGIPLAGETLGPFPSCANLVVIGQAKRWKIDNEVSESDLREYVGAAVLRADELRKNYSDRYGLLTPVSFAFWVTCDFSVGARRFADRMGLWYLNGKALSQLALRIGIKEEDIPKIEESASLSSW